MNILITGAGGWLGSELAEQLLEKGGKVKALVLGTSKKLEKLKTFFGESLEILEGDICNEQVLSNALDNIDIVYHLAAKVHFIPNNKEEEEDFYKINTHATEKLFNLCLDKEIKRIIFYSTVSVYEQSNDEININSFKNPNTAYGKSKLMAEEIGISLIKEKKLPLTIIEPVTVYGGEDVGNFEKLRSLANKGVMVRVGNGENKKTVIYYKDLISITLKIAEDKNSIGKVIICGTETISLNEIINTLINSSNKKVKMFTINKFMASFIINIFKFINIGIIRKIIRQISTLLTNNEYDISFSKGLIKNFTSFKEYYRYKN